MTSVSQPTQTPSTASNNTSTSQSNQSYASATKKAASSPPIATGSSSNSPAVAVGNTPAVQHGKSSSVSPVNGRAAIPPAVPAVSAPAIASSNTNGVDHARKASVSFTNGPPAGQKAAIQFGSLQESPAPSHSAPQIADSSPSKPMTIPSNSRTISPAHSPIPIPALTGGRPPSVPSNNGAVIFGSLGKGDGDRFMRSNSSSQGPTAPGAQPGHDRRGSSESLGNSGRGGYANRGGRGGSYNNGAQYPPQQMGPYPQSGNNQYRGGPQGAPRGGSMGFNQQRPINQYPNSPHQATRSPALANAMPGTPNMGQAIPMQGQQNYSYPNPYNMNTYNQFPPQPYGGMPQQYNQQMYPQMQYMHGGMPQSPSQGYQQPYQPGQYGAPQGQSMSRTPSQMSERPNSSMGQPQTPSMPPASMSLTPQPKPATPVAASFTRVPRKSAAIVIKNPDGEAIQIPTSKPPASPAPRIQTPPVVVATPPPKVATPQPARTDTPAGSKSQQDILREFNDKIQEAANKGKAQEIGTDKSDADALASEAAQAKADAKAKEDAKVAEAKATEAKAAEEAKASADAAAAKAKADEEEMDRIIKEMDENDARREKEQEERAVKRAAEKAIADKAKAEKEKITAAENDRKLKEQEAEMERLEDEREMKRLEAEAKAAGGDSQVKAVAEVDAKKDAVALAADVKAQNDAPATPSTLASKLSNLSLEGDSAATTPTSDDSMGPPPPRSATAEKRGKPAALNLTPLNTKPVEAPQPSAALQSLKSARFLTIINDGLYPPNISSPNPALNSAVMSKNKNFKYDKEFLLQFQKVFTEKPSMEFESQIKALIGDGEPGSARPGSARPGGSGLGPRGSNRNQPGTFAMGAFQNIGGGKTLPPGTSSEQRFAMSQGTLPRPTVNPMSSFSRPGGAFPSNPMTRSPSASNLGPSSPRNPKQSSQRQGSSRYKDQKQEAQAAKTMPLTAGMDLKPIAVTASGWKPRSIVGVAAATGAAGPAPGETAGGHLQPDAVQRKVKAALNKMTPEKFEKISDQILAIAAQSKDEADGRTLRQVIQLTFEKATDEAHWASMYAKFCKRMLETMSPDIKDENITDKNGNIVSGGNLFRKYLLNRCQEEFERGWKTDLGEKPAEEEEGVEKTGEAAMLSDAYYIEATAKRRGLGLVQFIGELYKLGMLTERIMHECVKKLVDYTGIPDEAEIESLTKLLKTIGGNLDSTEKGRPMMNAYFVRIQAMIDTPELPSRLKFMLMDIVDLRKKNWHSKEDNKGPKTLEEIRIEAEAAASQKAAESARGSQRGGGGGGGRMQQGRGDSRNFSGGGFGQAPPVDYTRNTVATDDLRRLGNKGGSSRPTGGPMSFGPTSMFSSQSRSNSGRKMGPGGSLSRTGEESGASSRTGTPPQQKEKEPTTSANAFSLLGDLNDSNETENPASPSSTASPALVKATPASAEASDDKNDS